MAEKKIIISGEIGAPFIGGVMAADLRTQFAEAAGGDIDIHIASPGGSMPEGFEIYNMIRDYKRENPSAQITITIKGEASSMASYLAVNPAADLVLAEDNATFMIHNPWNVVAGDYTEMEKMASILRGVGGIIRKAYAEKSGKTEDEIQSMMDTETWFFGSEMKDAGFIDEIIAAPAEEKREKEEAVAASRIRFSAMQDQMRKSDQVKADILKVAALFKNEIQANKTLNNKGASSPENKTGGSSMADEEKNLISADDITLDWLKANKPDVVDAIKNAATEEEKERQKEIDETEENSEDDSEEAKALFKAAKYGEKTMNAGEVAQKLMALSAEKKKKMLADRKEDAAGVPAVTGQAQKDEAAIIADIKAGIKSQRRTK